jgi:hypothetical protein
MRPNGSPPRVMSKKTLGWLVSEGAFDEHVNSRVRDGGGSERAKDEVKRGGGKCLECERELTEDSRSRGVLWVAFWFAYYLCDGGEMKFV